MKKFVAMLFLLGVTNSLYSQEKAFNRWSLEVSGGFNKSMGPLSPDYFSPTLNIGHADIGARYMLNEYFGFKGDFGFGTFNEAKGESPEFSTDYIRVNAQMVMNWGRMLNFEKLSPRLGMLGHFGAGFGRLTFEETVFNQEPDYVYNIITGVTGQFKLTNKIALTGDITYIHNGRQTYTFDGNRYNAPFIPNPPTNPFVHAPGGWWTGTLGLAFYLGGAEQHADWYIASDKYATKEELASEVNSIMDMLNDSDGDGVPDYLDKEPNTPVGAHVSFAGITLDSDNDGIADHQDACPFLPGPGANNGCPLEEIKEQEDYLKKSIQEGYVGVYFAFDSATPLSFSNNTLAYVSNFLKKNPTIGIEIKGYADELGPEDYNINLSEKRAKSVYDILVASGIDPSRLTYKGYGEDTSVDKGSSDARQLARKVSFEIK